MNHLIVYARIAMLQSDWGRGVTPAELARELRWPVSKVYRVLRVLLDTECIAKERRGVYRIAFNDTTEAIFQIVANS